MKVACIQAEPVILDRERTLDRLDEMAGGDRRAGARLAVFPETFIPAYPRPPGPKRWPAGRIRARRRRSDCSRARP